MVGLTLRLPENTAEQLDRLASKLERSRSSVAIEAIEDYIAREGWQSAEIEAGLQEAEQSDFADASAVAHIIRRFKGEK